jgi:uncharacterized protein YndB with AHSA1/START domain
MTRNENDDYARDVTIAAPPEQVFRALTTLEGLGGWWTPTVSGVATTGGTLTFGFEGLEETIVMHVDVAEPPSSVVWTCLRNDGHPEWVGTRVMFEMTRRGANDSVLAFRHEGLAPTLDCYSVCENGWHRFLASLGEYSEHGRGRPYPMVG